MGSRSSQGSRTSFSREALRDVPVLKPRPHPVERIGLAMDTKAEKLLAEICREIEVPCGKEHIRIFSKYLLVLKRWSQAYSLTSLIRDEDIVINHFIDSLLYVKLLPPAAKSLLDVGSGAGFPGVPIKIVKPSLKVYLLEASRKKAIFLKNLVFDLSIHDVDIIQGRIEDYPCGKPHVPRSFDVIVTRALFGIDELRARVSPLCHIGTTLILSMGPSQKQTAEDLENQGCTVIDVQLASHNISRYLVAAGPRTPR